MALDWPESDRLRSLYRQYIGDPDDSIDINLGFALFLGGIGLAIIALSLFLWSTTLETRSMTYYRWVRPAYALAMVSLPIMMLGIVVLLPSEKRTLYSSIGGGAITIVATLGFLYAYPEDWYFYGQDYTVEVIATYAVGLAAITASTGAALIAHYLDLAKAARVEVDAEVDDGPSYTDEEIKQDIDAAMDEVEFSWGGIEKDGTSDLRLKSTEEFSVHNVEPDTVRSSGNAVDDAVTGLKHLKGGEKTTVTSGATVESESAKLAELKRQQQQSQESSDGGDSLRERLRRFFQSLFAR